MIADQPHALNVATKGGKWSVTVSREFATTAPMGRVLADVVHAAAVTIAVDTGEPLEAVLESLQERLLAEFAIGRKCRVRIGETAQ